jgi:hypothetical protein
MQNLLISETGSPSQGLGCTLLIPGVGGRAAREVEGLVNFVEWELAEFGYLVEAAGLRDMA